MFCRRAQSCGSEPGLGGIPTMRPVQSTDSQDQLKNSTTGICRFINTLPPRTEYNGKPWLRITS